MIFDNLPDDGCVFVHATADQPALPDLPGSAVGVVLDEADLLELLQAVRGQWWPEEIP